MQYNKNLVIALKSDPEVLKKYAVERERGRIQIYMTQLADENKIIDSQLKYIAFKQIKILNDREWQEIIDQFNRRHQLNARDPGAGSLTDFKSDRAMVKTEELWTYQYLDQRTRKKIGQSKSLGYDVTYLVVREDNRWKVADVDFSEKQ